MLSAQYTKQETGKVTNNTSSEDKYTYIHVIALGNITPT